MYADYLTSLFQNMRDQLIHSSSRDQLWQNAARVEKLLDTIEPARTYDCCTLCDWLGTDCLLPGRSTVVSGEAVQHDLRRLIEDLSDAANMPASAVGEPVHTMDELSKSFDVSTKTISRWREQGLVARRFLFEGRKRVGFLHSSVQRFVAKHPRRVQRGQQFRHLTEDERNQIIEHGRRLIQAGARPSAAMKRIAKWMGRSVETVRYTLKQYDRDNRDQAILANATRILTDETKKRMVTAFRRGESTKMLAKRYDCTTTKVDRVINEMRARRLMELPLDFMFNKEFTRRNAAQRICAPLPEAERATRRVRPPADLPAYLAALYDTPLLTREQERHLFRKYNFLKYRASKLRETLDVTNPNARLLDEIERLYEEAVATKNQLIKANLRLVVSLARKRTNASDNFYTLVSDGNISLMRAIEKFDYGFGYKFSTYGTWAIVKNYARLLPTESKHQARFRTSQDDLLSAHVDDRGDVQDDETRHAHHKQAINRVLSCLTEREQQIITRRFGLDYSEEPLTLKEVGRQLGVSKERIRQIESRAIDKLRHAIDPKAIDSLN